MTKVIILGQEEKQQTKKPIEFVKSLENGAKFLNVTSDDVQPCDYDFIELICKNYDSTLKLDILFAFNDSDRSEGRSEGCLYLGRFNDGVVE